jgi:4-hydroxybenzoate polyprenyltransferase
MSSIKWLLCGIAIILVAIWGAVLGGGESVLGMVVTMICLPIGVVVCLMATAIKDDNDIQDDDTEDTEDTTSTTTSKVSESNTTESAVAESSSTESNVGENSAEGK